MHIERTNYKRSSIDFIQEIPTMKFPYQITNRILLAAGMFLAGAQMVQAKAMEPPPGPAMEHGMPHPGQHGGPMNFENGASPFLHGIELTEAQQDKIFEIRHNQAPQLRERAKAIGKAHKELHALTMSPDYDEAKAKTLIDSLSRASAEMMLMHVRAEHQIYALLTPEQRKQLEEKKNRHPMYP
jgi:periplasmic protein CpxP/Spy